ncbi:hypothetical protein D9619_007394 [Psilocybe cf. subviscida]|uniref:Major facilitator superfamily (MFS) profile domain-containing protein n=1 Tax=Psilocybe cf. subviscida TaxID=2480587 RepID=A0A8H5B1G4_9AGAR|nr:hypothetical protein D9619_007394 [Psilocybe cf. subviscida]
MIDTFRDATVGLFINAISGGRLLPFPDQRPDWEIPQLVSGKSSSLSIIESKTQTPAEQPVSKDVEDGLAFGLPLSEAPTLYSPRNSAILPEKAEATVDVSMSREDTLIPESTTLVDWYDENDQENPMNWSLRKRIFVLGLISFLTFSVYIGSAIYTPSIPGIIERFQVSQTTATLGLSLYVIGYGVGPLLFSPLSELPSIGRNPLYIITLFLFVIVQIPTIYAPNIQTLLAMRFFAGFFGSPALATGGASIQDMFPIIKLPYALIVWSVAAVCGPVLGPVIGGFAAMNKDWRWPIFELLWLGSFTFIILIFLLPETNGETILYKRAHRLRRLTGNPNLRSESEIRQSKMESSEILFEALLRPFQLMLEPAVFYANLYLALAYAIFYLWFEAFPLVYNDMYHFNLGQSGLPFLGLLVSAFFASSAYIAWNYYHVEPLFVKNGHIVPESRMLVALVASVFIPMSLFIFGWTSRPDIHWIAPTIGAALYLPGLFLLFQCLLVYLPSSYPKYAASILAGNDLFRSTVAGCFPLFGHALYTNVGIGPGCSLLAGLSIAMVPGLWVLYKYGGHLRARSKYASA